MSKVQIKEGQLIDAATGLAKALHRAADDHLPEKLAGIVKLHAGIAVGSAFIPIPGADMVAAAGNIWTMYIRINNELELPFAENVVKSLATGIVTNIGGFVVASAIFGSALKLVPGLGSVGGAALVAATIYGVTIASGIIYMKAVTKLLNSKGSNQINDQNLKVAVSEILEDKDSIKEIYQTAKASYKPSNK